MARRPRMLAWTLGLVAVVASWRCSGSPRSHTASGRAAPALPHESLPGGPVTLTSLLAGTHGRPAPVVFWASWCGPCAARGARNRALRAQRRRARQDRRRRLERPSCSAKHTRSSATTAGRSRTLRDAEGSVGSSYQPAHPADDIHRRHARAHPRHADRPAERALADARAGKRRTQLSAQGPRAARRGGRSGRLDQAAVDHVVGARDVGGAL